VNLLPIEASLPDTGQKQNETVSEEEQFKAKERIRREELYSDIETAAQITKVYMAMIIFSSIVAAIGVLNNNVAVIIGAMVIAHFGPNVALSLATTLGDLSLAKNALKTNILGIALAIGISTSLGLVLFVDPAIHEISSRTSVQLTDIVLALASGSAGVLAFTSGASAALIGVLRPLGPCSSFSSTL